MSKNPTSGMKKVKQVAMPKSVYIDTGYPIPQAYNEDILVILTRDPRWIYAYWDISAGTTERIKKKYGGDVFEKSQFVLRIHDVTGLKKFKGEKSRRFKEIPVAGSAKNWYINVENSGRAFCVQMGLKTRDGKFIPILLSNTINTPEGRVSEAAGEQWMHVYEDYDKLLKLSGIDKVGVGSLEMAKFLAKRWEYLNVISHGVFSGAFSGVFSRGFRKPLAVKNRNFWLVADAELIVYGATEPSAILTINDKPVQLNPDGTFSLRVAFPDGKKEFAIKAVSRDKIDERRITITAKRDTK